MNFLKGVVLGIGITASAYMMYNEGMLNKRKMIKQAKKWAEKLGME